MRPVNEITAEAENFRVEGGVIKRDPMKPEPEGTIVLVPFRITGYDPDCDGSLMASMAAIDKDGDTTGWEVNAIGLYPSTELVVEPDELRALFEANVEVHQPLTRMPDSLKAVEQLKPTHCSDKLKERSAVRCDVLLC